VKATEAKLLSFLQKSPQFVIPIYQRTYSWTDKQCRQLWDDILRAGSSDAIAGQPLRTLEDLIVVILAVEKEAEGLLVDIIDAAGSRATVNGQIPREEGTHGA